jgi:hypothetical protein
VNRAAVNGGKWHALIDKPAHCFGTVLDYLFDDLSMAEPDTRVQCVGDVCFDAIFAVEDCCDAALGVKSGTLAQFSFAENCDAGKVGCSQREG